MMAGTIVESPVAIVHWGVLGVNLTTMTSKDSKSIYIGSVCLERTRWGKREPSFKVSDWLPRFTRDGFDGVELWEFHYTRADEAERARMASLGPIAIFNSYVGFGDEDAEVRDQVASAIKTLAAPAVKYNLGGDAAKLDEYRRNLLAWAETVPSGCRLLCECHPGTVLEELDAAVAFFEDLDPVRFGVIAHISGDAEGLDRWLTAFGSRVQHMHLQSRGPESDPAVAENRERLAPSYAALLRHGFSGSLAIEFTRGIGREEDIEELYANACADMAYVREALSSA